MIRHRVNGYTRVLKILQTCSPPRPSTRAKRTRCTLVDSLPYSHYTCYGCISARRSARTLRTYTFIYLVYTLEVSEVANGKKCTYYRRRRIRVYFIHISFNFELDVISPAVSEKLPFLLFQKRYRRSHTYIYPAVSASKSSNNASRTNRNYNKRYTRGKYLYVKCSRCRPDLCSRERRERCIRVR